MGKLGTLACLTVLIACGFAGSTRGAVVTYSDKATFLSAAGSTLLESFETLSDTSLVHTPVVAPLLTLTPISSQSNAAVRSAAAGGHFATDGVKYLELGDPNLGAAGTYTLSLNQPATKFGFSLTDWGDAQAGTLTITTDVGEASGGIQIAANPPKLASGNLMFFGFTQSTTFHTLTLTSTSPSDGFGVDEIYLAPVPEPSTAALLVVVAVASLGRRSARRRQNAVT